MTTIQGLAGAGLLVTAWAGTGAAALTGLAGGGQPQGTIQPSLGVTYIIRTRGDFNHLGDVGMFAGNFAPSGWALTHGQPLSIVEYEPLFNVIGTMYGGDGQTTFAVPDLQGRVPIGTGAAPGLTQRTLGDRVGDESLFLTRAQLGAHVHAQPGGGVTGSTGGGQPLPNMQPSFALNYTINLQGNFPTRDGSGPDPEPLLAQVGMTARPTLSNGLAAAQGQVLPIVNNQAVFSLLGTNFGGDGRTTFALPDTRGRAVIGAGGAHPLAEMAGVESNTLTEANLPSHVHAMPGGGTTGAAGEGQAYSNMQPAVGLNYMIALTGIFPSRGDDGGATNDGPLVGEISLFAGDFTPSGWAPADGRLLPISQNTALFSVIGTFYGGDGKSTFALPDLRGRLAVGEGSGPGLSAWGVGDVRGGGGESLTLTGAEMAAHDHVVTPEPGGLGLVGAAGMGLLGKRRRGRRGA